jgi:hypothetical protein
LKNVLRCHRGSWAFIIINSIRQLIWKMKCFDPVYKFRFKTKLFKYSNPLLHEQFVKMAVFIEKPPVTSSNCYETIKKASILLKLGTNVDWPFVCVTLYSILNFLLPRQRGDISKLQKFTILRWFFSIKTDCCIYCFLLLQLLQLLNGWRLKAFQRWLHVALRLTWGHF